jgi:hypothetical protein
LIPIAGDARDLRPISIGCAISSRIISVDRCRSSAIRMPDCSSSAWRRECTGPIAPGGRSPESAADDGLALKDARITNAVKCLPPANKPLPLEIKVCNAFLRAELAQSPKLRVILALGTIAHAAVLRALDLRLGQYRFGHAAEHSLSGGRVLLNSYHCSRYNTQTRRLTGPMFEAIIERALALRDA